MTQQTIDDYRLKWLTKQVFRVRVGGSIQEECFQWIEENVTEQSYTYAQDVEAEAQEEEESYGKENFHGLKDFLLAVFIRAVCGQFLG